MADRSHDPQTLYRASLERIMAAWELRQQRPVEAIYIGGLAVECIIQALAIRNGAEHDARHSLPTWLARCAPEDREAIRRPPLPTHWSRLAAVWRNECRYWDRAALLRLARQQPEWRRYAGDDRARTVQFVKSFLQSAEAIHTKAVTQWQRSSRS